MLEKHNKFLPHLFSIKYILFARHLLSLLRCILHIITRLVFHLQLCHFSVLMPSILTHCLQNSVYIFGWAFTRKPEPAFPAISCTTSLHISFATKTTLGNSCSYLGFPTSMPLLFSVPFPGRPLSTSSFCLFHFSPSQSPFSYPTCSVRLICVMLFS